MTALALIFTLAAIGIAETRYLITKRMEGNAPVCFIGQDCHKVLVSRYNKILGVHNDILGLLFYLSVGFITALIVLEVPTSLPLVLFLGVMLFVGSLMSIYFTYLQGVVLNSWCFWCLMSAMTIWLMTIVFIFI